MSRTFKCPNCGAPLKYDGGPDVTMECPYCQSPVIIPEELRGGQVLAGEPGEAPRLADMLEDVTRLAGPLAEIARLARSGRKIEAVKLYRQTFGVGLQEAKEAVDKIERGEPVTMANVTVESITGSEPVVVTDVAAELLVPERTAAEERQRKRIGIAIAALTAIIIVVTILAFSLSGQIASPTLTPPGYASVVLQFGGEGIGPGWFQDARSIAVDSAGHIYVAEYTGGRVQVFDPNGTFITQWFVGDSGKHISDMTADRGGTVYVVAYGTILRVEGTTGQLLGELNPPGGQYWFEQVARTPDGGLVALDHQENLVRFDAEGNITQVLAGVVRSAIGESEPIGDLAVDGLGDILTAGVFNPTIFKFKPDGRFVDRFGGEGDAPGQFHTSIDAIAVDSQGRIYAADLDGIKVLNPTGGYLGMFEVEGTVRAMAFNEQNELFVVTSAHRVTRFRLNAP